MGAIMKTKREIEMKLEAELARITREHTVGDITEAEMRKQIEKVAKWFTRELSRLPIPVAMELMRDYAVRHYEPGNETLKIVRDILQ